MQSIGKILGMECTEHDQPLRNQPKSGVTMEEMEQQEMQWQCEYVWKKTNVDMNQSEWFFELNYSPHITLGQQ